MKSPLGILIVTSVVTAAAVSGLVSSLAVVPSSTARSDRPARTEDGHPNFNGVWQALNEANWDLQAHGPRPGFVTQRGVYPYEYAQVPAAPALALGTAGAVPGSVGVVEGDGEIPYTPDAAALKKENGEHWLDRDPELKCFQPGIPRAMYLPYPFQIIQGTDKIHMAFAFADAARTIHLDTVDGPPADLGMGHSAGRWDGDTLVVTITNFNDRTWFDRAGNFHSDQLRVVERLTPITPDAIHYEATMEDPNVFTRPWTIAMPLYRRLEPNAQLMEFNCVEFVEELVYGHSRKVPLVTHWEGETITMDITRRPPSVEKLTR